MTIPNWQHHSKKEKKRTLKPQAMRARREALRHFKKRHMNLPKREVSSYISYIPNQV
jgi:type II secretory pathway pseudopilin PulG